jgi:hypothetical protein
MLVSLMVAQAEVAKFQVRPCQSLLLLLSTLLLDVLLSEAAAVARAALCSCPQAQGYPT